MESLFATAKAVVTAHPYASAVVGVLGAGYVAANYWKRKGPSGFGSAHTAADVSRGIDLTGRVAVVTGANSGIGFETARVLALRGAHVVVVARSMEKAEGAIRKMELSIAGDREWKGASGTRPQFTPMVCDLADLDSVAAFVAAFKATSLPLHVLVNNAGVMAMRVRETTKQGLERQMGTNHVGHFALTLPLLPVMAASPGTDKRVVCLSSMGHRRAKPSFVSSPTLDAAEGYDPWLAYGNSKMANILFAREVNRRCTTDHAASGITAYSLHPGGIHTNLQTEVSWGTAIFWAVVTPFFFKSIPQGAATTVYCATAPGLPTSGGAGGYFSDCNLAQPSKGVASIVTDDNAARVWATTEKLSGISMSL